MISAEFLPCRPWMKQTLSYLRVLPENRKETRLPLAFAKSQNKGNFNFNYINEILAIHVF